jgi:hypothetical protein
VSGTEISLDEYKNDTNPKIITDNKHLLTDTFIASSADLCPYC